MTTILALSDTHLNKDGKLHSELKKLAATADLVLHAGDFISQETYDALKNACKGEMHAVRGVCDNEGLKDSNGIVLKSEEDFSPSTYIEFIGNEAPHNIRIYLVNDPIGAGKIFSENDVMIKAAAKNVDLLVYGVNYQPLIVWGKDGGGKYRMLVCPGSSSPFYNSSHSVVLLDVNDSKISRAKVVRIPITYQVGWRLCDKCKSLFWGPGTDKSKCPYDGKTHVIKGKNQYCLAHNDPNAFGQDKWRWCKSCQSLFFAPKSKGSICPANGNPHGKFSGSGDYTIIHNYPNDDPKAPGEGGWRLCKNCYGLFFAGKETHSGVCPNIAKGNREHVSVSDEHGKFDEYRVEVGNQ
jgi:putative phosphoesterase